MLKPRKRKARLAARDAEELDAANLRRVWAFRSFADFERNRVTNLKFIELYVHELVGMEEEILLRTFALDEPKALVSETGNCSLLHEIFESNAPDNHQVQEAE